MSPVCMIDAQQLRRPLETSFKAVVLTQSQLAVNYLRTGRAAILAARQSEAQVRTPSAARATALAQLLYVGVLFSAAQACAVALAARH